MSQNWSKKLSVFYSTKIAAAASNKELYSITNKLAAKTKCSLLPTIFPQSDLPHIFSDFFLNKIVKIRSEFGPQSPLPSSGKRFTGNPLTFFEPVTENTVRKFVQNSAPETRELDPIPTSLLMECLDIVLPIPTKIVNDSLTSGIFPQTHKPAAVKHMLKKPTLDHNNPKKFHPVSNLSFLSKIIEKIVLFQI